MIQALDAELRDGELPVNACEQLGWVRGSEIGVLHERARALYQAGDPKYAWPAWTTWMAVAMDLWLRATNVVQYPL